jgi:hypothetical protein
MAESAWSWRVACASSAGVQVECGAVVGGVMGVGGEVQWGWGGAGGVGGGGGCRVVIVRLRRLVGRGSVREGRVWWV